MNGQVGISFEVDTHTPFWIFTNCSAGDEIPISVDGEGDHAFNVTDELTYNLPGYGPIELWELKDLDNLGGIAWYDKIDGFLINGTFVFAGGSESYNFTFMDSNARFKDILDPFWDPTPSNQIVKPGTYFTYNVHANDLGTIDRYEINDTDSFYINSNTGLIINNTILELDVYGLEIIAYDAANNTCGAIIKITVGNIPKSSDIPGYELNIFIITMITSIFIIIFYKKTQK